MSHLAVRNVYLNYPLYGKAKNAVDGGVGSADTAPSANEQPTRSDMLIRGANGAVAGIRALQNISFNAASGERIGLVGENGSGKTTLLQLLAGIYTPDAGEVEILGEATSVVNINLGVNLEASGHRNITLRGLAAGRTREEIEARRDEIAAFSELGGFLDLPISTYSAGMRMRLNFAIATAFEPDILILDEWLSAGDAAFRAKATQRMKDFVSKAGILILASHSRSLLKDTCTRALWLDGGRLMMDGPTDEVLSRYDAEMARRQTQRDAQAERELQAARERKVAARDAIEVRARQQRIAPARATGLDDANPIVQVVRRVRAAIAAALSR